MPLSRIVAPVLALLLAACPGSTPPTPVSPADSGVSFDGGVPDAGGEQTDAGSEQTDGGTTDDGGTPALGLESSVLDEANTGMPYRAVLAASGGTAPYSWRVTLGAPVEGLTLAPDGTLSGTPAFAGWNRFTVEVLDSQGARAEGTVALNVTGLRYLPLPEAYVSEPYRHAFHLPEASAAQVWTVNTVPAAGLGLASNGILSGTPTSPGAKVLEVTVRDAGREATGSYFLVTVTLPSVLTTSLPEAFVAEPYTVTLQATGGVPPYTWSALPGTLPSGLTLRESGVLTGTLSGEGRTFTVTATDLNGRTASRQLTLSTPSALQVTSLGLGDGRVGQPYAFTLTASGGRAPLTWSFTGTLAAGLTLSTNGALSGTPTAAGTVPFTVTVRDADGKTASARLMMMIQPPLSLFTVGHWNLEWFGAPNQGPVNSTSDGGVTDDLQVAGATSVIRDARAHVWGLVEMVDTADFNTLKAGLPGGYNGFLANNTTYVLSGTSQYSAGEQKPGILYDSTLTYRSAQVILTAQAADFGGRPPLRVDFTTRIHGEDTPLVVIVTHMKAFEDRTSYDQRKRSATALKNYLDQWLPEARVLVIGDWNDDLDHSISTENGVALPSPYLNFLNDPAHYTFLTRVLTDANLRTTTEYNDVIDHTLVTDEVAVDAVPGGVQVLRPDTSLPDYARTVSDHYPVLTRYDLSGVPGPRVRLTAPLEGSFVGGSSLTFTWRSVGVSTVRIEASYDSGDIWNVVAPSVSAASGSFTWTVPDVESDLVRVRVVDTANASRFDMTPGRIWFTRSAPRVIINELLANEPALPGGTAHEFVELYNAGSAPVDLSGWTLWDALNPQHVFAPGTVLQPGRPLVVFGGPAGFPAGAPDTVAASGGTLALNNTSDVVQLKRADGGAVDSVEYSSTVDAVSINRSPDLTPDAGFALHTTLTPGVQSSPGRRADGGAF
ncbi:putative Ig domain-containing protein [Corallococcus interemptor]|uniref:putative Ig domain-containing protein n=1 Tax=Corallococcus interemptor TaxID=2316720 RepID=UPI001FC94EE7|nr:putative Ig domain-containing protein [Corallococcus interemptor]